MAAIKLQPKLCGIILTNQYSYFWQTKSLQAMSPEEWEALCDGCGRCCLHKLEDIETGLHFYTEVVCQLLDEQSCECTDYKNRKKVVAECVTINQSDPDQLSWLPSTCAYRLIAEGKDLEWWHPLLSGNKNTVHDAGISVRGRTINETTVSAKDMEDHIIHWIDF